MNNYKAKRGDTFTLNLTVTDANGAAQNITDWMFWMTLKTHKALPDGSAAIQQVGSTVIAESGTVKFEILPESTALFLGTYYYDLQYKDSTDVVKTIDSGVITFLEDVTITTGS